MEELYKDFTTKLLPQIQQGLVITKDYFMEFFGRYIKYLIVSDSISVVAFALLIVIGFIFAYKAYKYKKKDYYGDAIHLIAPAGICLIFGIVGFFFTIDNLIKDFYVPEVRILELINQKR